MKKGYVIAAGVFALLSVICLVITLITIRPDKTEDEHPVQEEIVREPDTHKGLKENETIDEYADRVSDVPTESLELSDTVDLLEGNAVDANNYSVNVPEVAIKYLESQAESALEMIHDLGLNEVSVYAVEQCNTVDNMCSVYINFANTDLVAIYTVDLTDGALAVPVDFPIVKYGSDYCPVYFANGVPANSERVYEYIMNNLDWDVYVTDYMQGGPCVLTDSEGNTFEVVVEE